MAVAVRAGHDAATPLLGEARDVGQRVTGPGGDDEATCGGARCVVGHDLEPLGDRPGLRDAGIDDHPVDGPHLPVAVGDELERGVAVAAEHPGRRAVRVSDC